MCPTAFCEKFFFWWVCCPLEYNHSSFINNICIIPYLFIVLLPQCHELVVRFSWTSALLRSDKDQRSMPRYCDTKRQPGHLYRRYFRKKNPILSRAKTNPAAEMELPAWATCRRLSWLQFSLHVGGEAMYKRLKPTLRCDTQSTTDCVLLVLWSLLYCWGKEWTRRRGGAQTHNHFYLEHSLVTARVPSNGLAKKLSL